MSLENLIIASNDLEWAKVLKENLMTLGHTGFIIKIGADVKLALMKSSFTSLILDIDIQDSNAFEILKTAKLERPSVKIYLAFQDKNHTFIKETPKLGITGHVLKSYPMSEVTKVILQDHHQQSPSFVGARSVIADAEMTRIQLDVFMGTNVSSFDFYLKVGPETYQKFLGKNERFSPSYIKSTMAEGHSFAYFKSVDRKNFIRFMNEISHAYLSQRIEHDPKRVLVNIKCSSDKFIEEIYTQGLKEDMVDESKLMSQNLFESVTKNQTLHALLNDLQGLDPTTFSHIFLVTFFSSLICKNIPWIGPKTRETVGLGALLHDIGMIRLPEYVREKNPNDMTPEEIKIFQEHPRLGAEILQRVHGLSEQVIHIVFQHHENVLGTGFPNGLNGIKMYPLAKIVSFAEAFVDLIFEKKLSPIQGMKIFLSDRDEVVKYDPEVVKALVKGFIN